jgi:hypothetical protein
VTSRASWTLINAQQGHKAIELAWACAKPLLIAGHRMVLEIRPEKRSVQQNRRYWGRGVLAQVAEKAIVNGRRYSAEVWHEQFKRQFIGVMDLPNGEIVGMSSKELTKPEFSAFCGEVEAYAATELAVVFEDLPHE